MLDKTGSSFWPIPIAIEKYQPDPRRFLDEKPLQRIRRRPVELILPLLDRLPISLPFLPLGITGHDRAGAILLTRVVASHSDARVSVRYGVPSVLVDIKAQVLAALLSPLIRSKDCVRILVEIHLQERNATLGGGFSQ